MGVNVFLSRESTQKLLSDIRPDRVQMTWEKAWSWYPGQVSVTGAKVSGQSPRFQWQADVTEVDGRVALLPFLQRKVVIKNIRIPAGEYRQRSRLKADGSNQAVSKWFPPIRNYELTPVGERPKPKKKPWTIVFEDAELDGTYSTWIQRFQAEVDLKARVNVDTRTQGGPLELRVEQLDAELHRLWADNDETIFNGGTVSGDLSLGPYRYREHSGGRAIRFLSTDVDIDLDSHDISFIELFLLRFESLNIKGTGRVTGPLKIDGGFVADGTNLKIAADDLLVSQPPFAVKGKGVVALENSNNPEQPFQLGMRYENLDIYLWEDNAPLISGDTLLIDVMDEGDLVPRKLQESPGPLEFTANINIPNAGIDDVAKFNQMLPDDSPMLFTGGQSDFTAKLTFTPTHIDGHYSLDGKQLTALVDQQLVGLDMRFDGVVQGATPLKAIFDLKGSVLELKNAQVIGEESTFNEENWSATANFTEASLSLLEGPELSLTTDLTVSDSRPFSALFANNGGPNWIAKRLVVSDLKGDAQMTLRNRDIYVPTAHIGAEDLEFAFKGIIAKPDMHGMAYFRYKRLDAGLKLENGKRDFVLIGPIKKFDAYSIEQPPPNQP